MCGIAGIVLAPGRSSRRRAVERARPDGRRAPPPRPRRARGLPRRARRARARAALDHRSGHRPAAARQRGRHALGRLQRRDLQLRRAARRARARWATPSARRATPRSSSTPSRSGATRPSSASTGSSRSRSGTRASSALVLARDPARRAAALRLRARGPRLLRERGEGHLRRRPADPARASIRSASTRPSRSGRSSPPRTVFAGVEELPPGHVRTYDAAGVRRARVLRACAIPRPARAAFAGSLEDADGGGARRAARGHAAAHAARRRAGRQLPLRRARQLARRRARPRGQGRAASAPSRSASRTPSTTRPRSSARWSRASAASTTRSWSRARDIAAVFPDVVCHAERPILRTAPAPLFLLSRLVRDAGIKVVLTGEGADEMFAGYDLFREGKVRRFWARHPARRCAPAPARAALPVPRALARRAAGDGAPVLRAEPRARRARRASPTSRAGSSDRGAQAALLARRCARALGGRDARGRAARRSARASSPRWSPLAQDQYLEIRTLLVGLPPLVAGRSHADGALGRGPLPVPRRDVVALANSLPAAYKLRVLDEKHVLKRAAAGLVPAAIIARKKQPYRAPDALSFVGAERAGVGRGALLDERAVRRRRRLRSRAPSRCSGRSAARRAGDGQFSNADNMALVGVLSTQLLHDAAARAAAPEPVAGRARGPTRSTGLADGVPMTRRPAAPRLPRATPRAALPDKIALVVPASGAHLRASSTRAPTRWRTRSSGAGVERGDRVLVFADNTVESGHRVLGRPQGERGGLDGQPADQGRQARLPPQRLPGGRPDHRRAPHAGLRRGRRAIAAPPRRRGRRRARRARGSRACPVLGWDEALARRRRDDAAAAPRASTSTSPRSSTPPAAPASPRA